MRVQPRIDVSSHQCLSDQAARHDGALIDIKRQPLKPRLAGQVGSRFARLDARLNQLLYRIAVGMCNRAAGDRRVIEVGIEG